MTKRVAFIGIGKMGWPMAARLVDGGYELTVADASDAQVSKFSEQRSARKGVASPELGADADVVITMLPTSDIVEKVLLGPRGVLAGAKPDTLFIEMSSGVPGRTRAIATLVRAAGCDLIDAPVSGGVARAKDGSLAIIVGGAAQSIDRAEPLLSKMGSSILRIGDVGAAHAMKALNNLASAAGLLATIEVLLIGKRYGLDPAVMVDILNASTGMNNSTQKKMKQFVLSRTFDSGFSLDLMLKDITIALDVARDTSTAAPFSALCRELTAACASMLGAGHDHTELAKMSEQLAGSTL